MRVARLFGALFWFTILSCGAAAADGSPSRYLVEGRVRVDLFPGADREGGDLWWLDTVSGASGDARFSSRGSRLVVNWGGGLVGEARLVPKVAIVFSLTPWGQRSQDTALGLSLD